MHFICFGSLEYISSFSSVYALSESLSENKNLFFAWIKICIIQFALSSSFFFFFFSKIKREWYGYHFPELIKSVSDNNMYAKVVKIVKNRKELTEELQEQIEEVVLDSAKAKAVIDASKSSMGK